MMTEYCVNIEPEVSFFPSSLAVSVQKYMQEAVVGHSPTPEVDRQHRRTLANQG
jgi:hypothetical protein